MKNYFTHSFLVIIVVFISNVSIYSQFGIRPSIGLSIPASDYSGTLSDYYSGKAYGLSSGLNLGLAMELGTKVYGFTLVGSMNYSMLKSSGSPSPSSTGNIDLKQNLFTFTAGPTYYLPLAKDSKIEPYFGINLLYTFISGSVTFTGVKDITNGGYDMQTASRLGIGIKLGTQYNLAQYTFLNIEFNYNFINAFSKNYGGGDAGRIGSYQSLNDDKDPSYSPGSSHPIGQSRAISVFLLNMGIEFWLK